MSRPYVNILSDNIINELYEHLESMLPKFQSLPGVIGITLLRRKTIQSSI